MHAIDDSDASAARLRARRIALNTTWLLLANGVSGLFTYGASIYLARTLSVENYGTINYLLNFGVVGFQLFELGLNTQIQRDAALVQGEDGVRFPKLFGARILLSLGWLIPSFGILAFYPQLRTEVAATTLILVASCADAIALSLVFRLYGSERMGVAAIANLLRASVPLVLLAILVHGDATATVAAIYLAGAGLRLGMLAWLSRRQRAQIARGLQFRNLALVKDGWQFGTTELLMQLNVRFAPLVLAGLKGPAAVANFSVAALAFLAGTMFTQAYNQSIWPSLVRNASDPARFRRTYLHVQRFPVLFMVIVVPAGYLLAAPVVRALFLDRYLDAIPAVQVMIGAVGVSFFAMPACVALAALNGRWMTLLSSTATGGVAIVLNFVLVPRLSFVGSAWATLAAYLVGAILFNLALWRMTRSRA